MTEFGKNEDNLRMMPIRGVSDVGFSIFADTDADADFAF